MLLVEQNAISTCTVVDLTILAQCTHKLNKYINIHLKYIYICIFIGFTLCEHTVFLTCHYFWCYQCKAFH